MAAFSIAIATVPTSKPNPVGLPPSPASPSNTRLTSAAPPFHGVLQHNLNARAQTTEQASENAAAPGPRRWPERDTNRPNKSAVQGQPCKAAGWASEAAAAELRQEKPENADNMPCAAVAAANVSPCELPAAKPFTFSFPTSAAAILPVLEETSDDTGAELANDSAVTSDSKAPSFEGFSFGFAGSDVHLKSLIAGSSLPSKFEAFRLLASPPSAQVPRPLPHSPASQAQPASPGAAPRAESGFLEGFIESTPTLESAPIVIQGSLQRTATGELTDGQSVIQPITDIVRPEPGHVLGDLPGDSRVTRIEFNAPEEQRRAVAVTLQASEMRIQSQFPSSMTKEIGLSTTRSAFFRSGPDDSVGENPSGLSATQERTRPEESAGMAEGSQPPFRTAHRRAREFNDGSGASEGPQLDAGLQATTHPQRLPIAPTSGSSASASSQPLHQDPPPVPDIAESALSRRLTIKTASQPEPPGTRSPLRQLTVRLESGAQSRLDVQFTEAGGSVNVKIRTHSDLVAGALLGEVSQLESDLNSRGWRAELSALRSTSEGLPGGEDHSRHSEKSRTGTLRGNTFQESTGQSPTSSEHSSDSPKRQRDWSSDEQELSDLAALRRLAVKGEPQ